MASNHQIAKPVNSIGKHDKGYGTPVEGSKTEARAKLAHERISREILDLCTIIYDCRTFSRSNTITDNNYDLRLVRDTYTNFYHSSSANFILVQEIDIIFYTTNFIHILNYVQCNGIKIYSF